MLEMDVTSPLAQSTPDDQRRARCSVATTAAAAAAAARGTGLEPKPRSQLLHATAAGAATRGAGLEPKPRSQLLRFAPANVLVCSDWWNQAIKTFWFVPDSAGGARGGAVAQRRCLYYQCTPSRLLPCSAAAQGARNRSEARQLRGNSDFWPFRRFAKRFGKTKRLLDSSLSHTIASPPPPARAWAPCSAAAPVRPPRVQCRHGVAPPPRAAS